MKPGPLLSRPRIKEQDSPYLDAFHALSRSRPDGFAGPGAIPISEVLAYLDLNGIGGVEQRQRFLNHVQRLDQVYKDWARAEAQKNMPKG